MSIFPTPPAPIYTGLPQNVNTLARRLDTFAPVLNRLPQPIPTTFQNIQLQRIHRGQAPWSTSESAQALAAAQTGQAVTQPRDPSPWSFGSALSNFRGDLGAILSSIPRLPQALFNEVRALPTIPQHISSAIAAGDNPISAIASAPGVRFLPGSYIAENLARGDVTELARHPLFTTLDILPAAGKAAELTQVGQAAKLSRAAEAAGEIVPKSGLNPNSLTPRPLRALATRRLDRVAGTPQLQTVGNYTMPILAPNRAGRAINRFASDSPIGRALRETFGRDTRRAMRSLNYEEALPGEVADLRIPIDEIPGALDDPITGTPGRARLYTAARQAFTNLGDAIDRKTRTISDERVAEITRGIQLDPASVRATATPDELIYIDELVRLQSELHAVKISDQLIAEHAGFTYDYRTARRLNRLDAARRAAVDRFPILIEKLDNILATGADDARLTTIRQHLVDGNAAAAKLEFTNLFRRKTNLQTPSKVGAVSGPAANIRLDSLKNLRNDIDTAAKAEVKYNKLLSTTPPPSMIPAVQEEFLQRFTDKQLSRIDLDLAEGRITVPESEAQRQATIEALTRKSFDDIPGFDQRVYDDTMREAAASWQMLAERLPEKPIFIHHRSREKMLHDIKYPKIRVSEYTPSSIKERLLDFTPTVDDATIAIAHEALELLVKQGTDSFLDTIEQSFAIPLHLVRDQYRDVIDRKYAKNPSIPYTQYTQDIISRDWIPFNRESLMATGKDLTGVGESRAAAKRAKWRDTELENVNPGDLFIPRDLYNNLRRLTPYDPKSITALFDPVMNTFRTSVLPLSPRWHVYNILGGAIMTTATGGLGTWKHLSAAIDLVRNPDKLPPAMRRTLGGQQREIAEVSFLAGATTRRIMDGVQQHLIDTNHPGTAKSLAAARKAGRSVIDTSFKANTFIDDMFRSMLYLRGKSKGSVNTGLALSRKALMAWDEMTPIERTVLRSILPFYGWTSHILRYTLNYPLDHPIRAGILSAIGRSELEDLGSGLPQSMLDFLTFGDPDSNGNIKSISTRGWNPFSDVANLFTLAGFLGGATPAITIPLQSLGIDPLSGASELYPDLRYDPQTGRLVADTGNFFTNAVSSIVPQSRLITSLSGISSDYRDLMRTNPDSARRLLAASIGLPTIYRRTNPTEQLMIQEVRRYQDQRRALSDAMQTGDDAYARDYTGLRARLQQMRALQSQGALAPFTPSQESIDNQLPIVAR